MVILADCHDSLKSSGVGVVVLGEDFAHCLLRHLVERVLEERGKAELKLHEVAHKHHQILCESLELHKVSLNVLHLAAVLADALIDFLEEQIVRAVYLLEHLTASCLLSHSELVVDGRNVERGLEHAEVRQSGKVCDTHIGSYRCLEIHTHKLHVVFHSSSLVIVVFLSEKF